MDNAVTHLTWTDQWGCLHTVRVDAAIKELKEFYDEWPGGLQEIDSCINMWKKKAEGKE